ncbi:hypothetical protein CVIRNUC_004656 [Coccomyxa viridis]|uniref:RING-type domain-containing protein n=1 Tax=Coccomyxa viridis TaxID=1274662 RepID=A0AAV1I3L5_9CHLO|nr:hypothetical protein CVIRNUC_004656 [Coccomyxa viridis]
MATKSLAAEVAAHSAQPTTIALGACCICFDAIVPEQDIRCNAPIRGTAVHKVQLSCQHCFHKECIRSCILFGNKDSCPVCNETVNLSAVFPRPCLICHRGWVMLLGVYRQLFSMI